MAAYQAPPSLGFSRQEPWSRLSFPSPMCESEVTQSCPTLSYPMDCSPPGSSVHGIFQARVLEWGAITFSNHGLDCILIYIFTYHWHPTPVLLPGKSHGWRSLVGCSAWGHKELDTTERLHYSLGPPGAPKHKSLSMSPVSYVQKRSFIQLP